MKHKKKKKKKKKNSPLIVLFLNGKLKNPFLIKEQNEQKKKINCKKKDFNCCERGGIRQVKHNSLNVLFFWFLKNSV